MSSFGVTGGWVRECSYGRRVVDTQRVLLVGASLLRTRELRLPEHSLTHPPAIHAQGTIDRRADSRLLPPLRLLRCVRHYLPIAQGEWVRLAGARLDATAAASGSTSSAASVVMVMRIAGPLAIR